MHGWAFINSSFQPAIMDVEASVSTLVINTTWPAFEIGAVVVVCYYCNACT